MRDVRECWQHAADMNVSAKAWWGHLRHVHELPQRRGVKAGALNWEAERVSSHHQALAIWSIGMDDGCCVVVEPGNSMTLKVLEACACILDTSDT